MPVVSTDVFSIYNHVMQTALLGPHSREAGTPTKPYSVIAGNTVNSGDFLVRLSWFF